MPVPIREQILQALATRLSAIRGLEQFDIRDVQDATGGILTVLVDGEDSAQPAGYDTTNVTLPVIIGRITSATGTKADDWHTQANALLADLIVDAYGSDPTLGGLAEGIDYTGGKPEVITDGAKGVAAQIFLDIRFQFITGNPYSNEV